MGELANNEILKDDEVLSLPVAPSKEWKEFKTIAKFEEIGVCSTLQKPPVELKDQGNNTKLGDNVQHPKYETMSRVEINRGFEPSSERRKVHHTPRRSLGMFPGKITSLHRIKETWEGEDTVTRFTNPDAEVDRLNSEFDETFAKECRNGEVSNEHPEEGLDFRI